MSTQSDREKLDEILAKSLFLSEWEDSFMADVYAKIVDGIPLSDFESQKFTDIYEKLRWDI